MSRFYLFTYGTLLNESSFEHTLGRRPEVLLPGRLPGWRRRWSLVRDNLKSEKVFARRPGGELPRWIVGLNIEPDPSGNGELAPNGALIEVTGRELERLDLRERRYDRIQVTPQVGSDHDFDGVFAYTARPEHYSARPPEGAVVMAAYVRAVQLAFAQLEADGWETFIATTGPPPVEQIEGVLIRDEIPPGNPRDW
jgi:Gamma-glutamyl cyclotransferase, AIG2-like